MSSSAAGPKSPPSDNSPQDTPPDAALLTTRLREVIDRAAHLLPAQGPITVFIHHNTLHGFEDLPFTEAVEVGGALFGCEPYLSKNRYRQELGRGRIRLADVEAVLGEELGDQADQRIVFETTRQQLRLAMIQYPLRSGTTEELTWLVAETDALRKLRRDVSAVVRGRFLAETRRWVMRELCRETDSARPDDPARRFADLLERFNKRAIETWTEATWESFTLQALWRVCRDGVDGFPTYAALPRLPVRHRDLIVAARGPDPDLLVHDILIPFCAAYLDQGLAHWPLPLRGEGFLRAFCALYRQPGGPPETWRRGLSAELARLDTARLTPLESIRDSLETLGVVPHEWDRFLTATLLALRGWAGMIRQVEVREDRVVRPIAADSLTEFLALRLILDRLAVSHIAREAFDFNGPPHDLRPELRKRVRPGPPSAEQRAFQVFQLAQAVGWTPEELQRLSRAQWSTILREMEIFSEVDRRRIFHLAYERRFVTQSLDVLCLRERASAECPVRPTFQAVFCLDEREESIRRHLEEVAPAAVTFGTAGYFAAAMYYRGAADAHFVPLCPAVVRPEHWVAEQVADQFEPSRQRWATAGRVLGLASHRFHVGSRSFLLGAVASVLGVFATAPLVARTVFPRLTSRIRGALGRFIRSDPPTRLVIERTESPPGPENGHVGFTVAEMSGIAEQFLRDIGLTDGFARLVLVIGHGSSSLNNPHESAYDCGACGGSAGGPNGRAVAQMLNDVRVRGQLNERGVAIPAETCFIGGLHNTCVDTITIFDRDRLPESHRGEFATIEAQLQEACDRNAHERCRRFRSAPLTLDNAAARQHIEGRAEDLAQVRPELGHATNAICLVGRRARTRGLFLDRRMFLVSYDPGQDDSEATILARTLAAVFPVCGGISLEYYFSHVDPAGYGCGTKLPHNITALLGVMDGAASDLRTGLPWQMVEFHEPLRLLIVIEATAEALVRIAARNPDIGRLIHNEWVSVALLDPDSEKLRVYRNGKLQPYHPQAERVPRAASSADWYRGWREHLEFAEISN